MSGGRDEQSPTMDTSSTTGPYGCTVRIGETTASLWGIVLGQWGPYDRYASRFDPYARVVMAELASEALAEVDKEAAKRARAARMDVATLAH